MSIRCPVLRALCPVPRLPRLFESGSRPRFENRQSGGPWEVSSSWSVDLMSKGGRRCPPLAAWGRSLLTMTPPGGRKVRLEGADARPTRMGGQRRRSEEQQGASRDFLGPPLRRRSVRETNPGLKSPVLQHRASVHRDMCRAPADDSVSKLHPGLRNSTATRLVAWEETCSGRDPSPPKSQRACEPASQACLSGLLARVLRSPQPWPAHTSSRGPPLHPTGPSPAQPGPNQRLQVPSRLQVYIACPCSPTLNTHATTHSLFLSLTPSFLPSLFLDLLCRSATPSLRHLTLRNPPSQAGERKT